MISVRGGWVFVHPKKTAGTSVARALMPYSDERLRPIPGMSADEDFEIVGPLTPSKHTPLRHYRTQLGARCDELILIGGVRHPLDRMLSLYHYWRRRKIGTPSRDEAFNDQSFINLVGHNANLSDSFRQPDGTVRLPDIMVEPSTVERAMVEMQTRLSLPTLPIGHFNRSPKSGTVSKLRQSRTLATFVYDAQREDYEVFGYELFPDL